MLNIRSQGLLIDLLRSKAKTAVKAGVPTREFVIATHNYLSEVEKLVGGFGTDFASNELEHLVDLGIACVAYGFEMSYNMNRGCQE